MKNPSLPSEAETVYSRRALAIALSVFLLIEGVWGFFSPVVLVVLTTNHLHAGIHVVLGIVGFWAISTGHARAFLLFLGALLGVVGLLWFAPFSRNLVLSLLAVNQAVALINLIIGTVCLLVVVSSYRAEKAMARR